MNSTICVAGCSHEDRFFSGYETTLEIHGTLHRVCGNCESRLIEDHDAHVDARDDHNSALDWVADASTEGAWTDEDFEAEARAMEVLYPSFAT